MVNPHIPHPCFWAPCFPGHALPIEEYVRTERSGCDEARVAAIEGCVAQL